MKNEIVERIKEINASLEGTRAQLVAVSKTKPIEDIQVAYDEGQRIFGENKVQELVDKYEALPKDIEWHMIGHLQRNKVKYITPFVSLIHGVDTEKLLLEINKQGKKNDRIISCLLQVHIAQEESKFGFNSEEIQTLFKSDILNQATHISIKGLMGMATHTEDKSRIREEFASLRKMRDKLSQTFQHERLQLEELSMGMSGDYLIALEEGSTMIRLGSTIFGSRH